MVLVSMVFCSFVNSSPGWDGIVFQKDVIILIRSYELRQKIEVRIIEVIVRLPQLQPEVISIVLLFFDLDSAVFGELAISPQPLFPRNFYLSAAKLISESFLIFSGMGCEFRDENFAIRRRLSSVRISGIEG